MKLEYLHAVAKTAFDSGVSSQNPCHVLAYVKMVVSPYKIRVAQAALTAMLRELEAEELGYHCAVCKLYNDMMHPTKLGETLSVYV